MKAYLGIKYHPDNRNRATIEEISKVLATIGYETTCVVRDLEKWGEKSFSAPELMRKTFAIIDECDVAIIDLTEKGVGLGIEAGYAHARGAPLVTIARQGSDISETLRGISDEIILYDDFDGLALEFSKRLEGD